MSAGQPFDVAVVVPVFNRAAIVRDAVDSVVAQDVDAEIVLVDDGSTDGTAAVLRQIAAELGDRVVVVEQPNAGPARARNAGVAAARADLVTFLDSDDLMEPGRLRVQLDTWRAAPGEVVVMGHERVEVAPGVEPPRHILDRGARDETRYHTSVLLSREQFATVGGFDEGLRVAEDVDFVLRLEESGFRVVLLDDVMITRRILGDNLVYDPAVGRSLFLLARRRVQRARDRTVT
jgi:glycosyltransferase involved in cell wall biosynthesis